jgi:hypothetical protein
MFHSRSIGHAFQVNSDFPDPQDHPREYRTPTRDEGLPAIEFSTSDPHRQRVPVHRPTLGEDLQGVGRPSLDYTRLPPTNQPDGKAFVYILAEGTTQVGLASPRDRL